MKTFGEGEDPKRPYILAIGCGGAGCNIIEECAASDIPGVNPIFINHKNELGPGKVHEDSTITLDLGKANVHGPEHAEAAIWRAQDTLKEIMSKSHLTFIVCGLGGITGSGTSAAVAQIARMNKNVTIALTVHPFRIEGQRRQRNVKWCMERLLPQAHSVVSIHNEKLFSLAPDISFGQALEVTNQMAISPIRDIAALATLNDIKHIRKVMDCLDVHIGFGGSNRDLGLSKAVDEVVESLMPGPIQFAKECDRGLITVRAGPGVLDREVSHIVGCLAAGLHPSADVLWGSIRDDTLGHGVRIISIIGQSKKETHMNDHHS